MMNVKNTTGFMLLSLLIACASGSEKITQENARIIAKTEAVKFYSSTLVDEMQTYISSEKDSWKVEFKTKDAGVGGAPIIWIDKKTGAISKKELYQ